MGKVEKYRCATSAGPQAAGDRPQVRVTHQQRAAFAGSVEGDDFRAWEGARQTEWARNQPEPEDFVEDRTRLLPTFAA